MSFPRYPKYKDSGVEWLGEVPDGWGIAPLKRGYEVVLGKMLQPAQATPEHVLLPYLRAANLQWAGVDTSDLRSMWFSPHERSNLLLQEGDLLVSEGGDVGRTAIWKNELNECYFQNSVNRIRSRGHDLNGFLYYWLSAIKEKGFVDALCNKSTIAHFTADKVGAVPTLYPSQFEQSTICAFLDRETAKIDALIEEQRRLIGLLKEKRQAVISHAVTKGLGSCNPMKRTENEWLGSVPCHWKVTPIKWVADVESGHTPDKKIEAYWGGSIPWVSLNDTGYLRDHDFISETAYSITEEGMANSSARLIPARAVVFSRDATIGRCAITTREMAVSQHFIAWVCGELIRPEYLLHVCRAMLPELERLSTGATLRTIGMSDVNALVTPLPPVEEQEAIEQHIQSNVVELDRATEEIAEGIRLLQERRSALIWAGVTGKIDIRQPIKKPVASVKPYNSGFAHQLLAAAILERYNDKHMGRVKLQKLIHVAEYHAQIEDLKGEYTRQMAGPLDMKAMAGLERGLEKQHWYKTVRDGQRYRYQPLEKKDQHQKYLEQWADKQDRIEEVLILMGGMNMRQCEIVSTLYAAWNDLLIDGLPATDDAILDQAATAEGWHESKERTPRDKWVSALQWMCQHALIPTGFGSHTRKAQPESIHEPA